MGGSGNGKSSQITGTTMGIGFRRTQWYHNYCNRTQDSEWQEEGSGDLSQVHVRGQGWAIHPRIQQHVTHSRFILLQISSHHLQASCTFDSAVIEKACKESGSQQINGEL